MNYETKKRQFKNWSKKLAADYLALAKKATNKNVKLKAMKAYHRCEQDSRS